MQRLPESAKKVMVVDVGGTHIKVYANGHRLPVTIDSGPRMSPKEMVEAALKRRGKKKWMENVFDVVAQLKNALLVDYVVLEGGNSGKLTRLPPGTWLVDNQKARDGGFCLWNSEVGRDPRKAC